MRTIGEYSKSSARATAPLLTKPQVKVRDTTRYTFDFPLDIDMLFDQSEERRVECERLFACYPALAQYSYKCFDVSKSLESQALALQICRHVARMPYVVWH